MRLDHPLVADAQRGLRRRVIDLFQNGYSIRRSSNIVFVCGGNDATHMRMRFREYCSEHLPDYEIFLPESAMENVLAGDAEAPFDIARFEELVGELSHAIVVFPEAPGSCAETGYFSAVHPLAEKCILVLDLQYQAGSSFISLGPARKIANTSFFQHPIQLDYVNPDFDAVAEKIKFRRNKKSRSLTINNFNEMRSYDLSAIIHEIVSIASIATFDDVLYIMRGIFQARVSIGKIQELMSILIGAEYLSEIGRYGHVRVNPNKSALLEVKDGFREQLAEIKLSLADVYLEAEADFVQLVEEAHDAV